MKHATSDTHRNLFTWVAALIAAAGDLFRRDVRSSLRPVHVNPSIRLVVNFGQNNGELLPEDNGGIALLDTGLGKHMTWILDKFRPMPAASDDPTLDYLNGNIYVDAEGVVGGHAHLHVFEATETQQVNDWMAGKPGVARPASYRFFGGHAWYRTEKLTDGTYRIRANSFTGQNALKPDTLYIAIFDLVHVDDTKLTAATHGMDSASLVTIFRTLTV